MKRSIAVLVSTFLVSMVLSSCGEVKSNDIDGGEVTVDANQPAPDSNNAPDANDNPTICIWNESNWDECNWAP